MLPRAGHRQPRDWVGPARLGVEVTIDELRLLFIESRTERLNSNG